MNEFEIYFRVDSKTDKTISVTDLECEIIPSYLDNDNDIGNNNNIDPYLDPT